MHAVNTAALNTPLGRRMSQDMKMRGFGEHTQKDYARSWMTRVSEPAGRHANGSKGSERR